MYHKNNLKGMNAIVDMQHCLKDNCVNRQMSLQLKLLKRENVKVSWSSVYFDFTNYFVS